VAAQTVTGILFNMPEKSGYKLIDTWFNFCQQSSVVRPVHTALYLYCITLCNKLRWKEVYGLPTDFAMDCLGISSYKTYINTLNDLIEFGFITMHQRSKNQYTSNQIALVFFTEASPKQSRSTYQSKVSIVKQLKTYKNVSKVSEQEEPKTVLFNLFKKVRSDLPDSEIFIEVGKFENKYPNKDPVKDINLINAWAKKIKYIPDVNPVKEFDKIAQANKEKYGS
jgi:hypothetical protein